MGSLDEEDEPEEVKRVESLGNETEGGVESLDGPANEVVASEEVEGLVGPGSLDESAEEAEDTSAVDVGVDDDPASDEVKSLYGRTSTRSSGLRSDVALSRKKPRRGEMVTSGVRSRLMKS